MLKRPIDALTVAPDDKDIPSARRKSTRDRLAATATTADDDADMSGPHYPRMLLLAKRRICRLAANGARPFCCRTRKASVRRAKSLGLTIGKKCPAPGTTTNRALGRQSR